MKYFAIILALCFLLGGCAVPPEATTPQNTPTQQGELLPPQTDLEADLPVPPETPPPTGTDSDLPGPEEGPEGLPTPAL